MKSQKKVPYEKPRVEVVRSLFSNSCATTYDATSHKRRQKDQ